MKGKKTGGRKRGTPNQTTTALKEAILNAFNTVGGESYLAQVAAADPKTFCILLGKVLPLQVTGANGGPIGVEIIDPILRRSNP